MLKYTIKRLLVAIPTFFGITVLVYLISLLAPGSPLEMLMADPMDCPVQAKYGGLKRADGSQ